MGETRIEKDYTTVEFGEGTLVIETTREVCIDSYVVLLIVLGREMLYRSGSHPDIPVTSLQDIMRIAALHRISIVQEVSSRPKEFASLIASYESLGIVLFPTWRYESFQEKLHIDLEANRPRVEGTVLRFIGVQMDLRHNPFPVQAVAVNLVDLTYSAEVVGMF